MKTNYSLFDTLLEPVFILNSEQMIIYCNETAATLAGLSIRKLKQKSKFCDVFTFSEKLEWLQSLSSLNGPTPYREITFTNSSGTEGRTQITAQPLIDDTSASLWIVFFRDVTLEERLQKKYRAELEKKEAVIRDLEVAKGQLEDYSKNLEQKVFQRTQELFEINQKMSALLNSLGQGFFIFNEQGLVLDVSSKACKETVECTPNGKFIWDVLKQPHEKKSSLQKWMLTIFQEMLPFDDLAPLGPNFYPHSEGKHISLEYHPLRGEAGRISGVVVVATDITSLVEAQQQAENEKEYSKLIINFIKSKREIHRFIKEAEALLLELNSELKKSVTLANKENVMRCLHTIKGGAALFSVHPVAESCDQAEDLIAPLQKGSLQNWNQEPFETKVGEIQSHFLKFLSEASEILGSNFLNEGQTLEISQNRIQDLVAQIQNLPGGAPIAEGLLLEFTLEPAEKFLKPFSQVITQLSHNLGKTVKPLKITNGSVKLHPGIYNHLFSTLVHAFRNAMDHGIEMPDERFINGKDEEGSIAVEVDVIDSPEQAILRIQISDDGAGINPEAIRNKLASQGYDSTKETDENVIQHIFDSQFSTRETVTSISGRGVGMDAIKFAAADLGGQVWVQSQLGIGTRLIIEVPYIKQSKAPSRAA